MFQLLFITLLTFCLGSCQSSLTYDISLEKMSWTDAVKVSVNFQLRWRSRRLRLIRLSNWQLQSTVKPDLTTTCEQRPPVNCGQFEPSTASLNLSFIRHLCLTAAFFRSQGWPLYTGLTVCVGKILEKVVLAG